MEPSNNRSDNTLRCRTCEGRLAPSPIELEGPKGQMYICRECGGYWFLQQLLTKEIMIAMEVQA